MKKKVVELYTEGTIEHIFAQFVLVKMFVFLEFLYYNAAYIGKKKKYPRKIHPRGE